MVEDIEALLGRQFAKEEIAPVATLVNEMFAKAWKDRENQPKAPERAFESYTKPSRKHLH